MKKLIFLIAVIFSFSVVSFAFGVSSVERTVERATVGHQRAMEAINTSIERMEVRGTNMNTQRLREVLALLLLKTEQDDFCHDFDTELNYKDESDGVKALQEALRKEGHFKGSANSYYGWDLARALYDYQNENDITPDGDLEKMGFVLSEEARENLNHKYSCEIEDDDEDNDEEKDDDEDDENDEE